MKQALVTGGGGFLGGKIVDLLLARGVSVRSLARGDYPSLKAKGVELIRGDLANPQIVEDAARGCDIIFHVAAKAGVWGAYEDYYRTNVVGTENVIKACRTCGIGRLVYTSSPSVVFDGSDMEGVDESTPYPDHFEAHYPRTKALAEQMVLGANDMTLSTVALRPHIIWGPGDNHLIPRLLDRARSGALRQIGDGSNLVDTVYIDNAAHAHLLAAQRLSPDGACAGKAYFISQGEPRPLWGFVNAILAAAGLPPVVKRVSPRMAYVAGAVMEFLWGLVGAKSEPKMTRFLARELSTAHWFDISAAKRDLGYEPEVSIDEGLVCLSAYLARL